MIKLFGSNYEELGSSKTNLILNTLGKIKIRFGSKCIDLIDENGELNGLKELERRISILEGKINN